MKKSFITIVLFMGLALSACGKKEDVADLVGDDTSVVTTSQEISSSEKSIVTEEEEWSIEKTYVEVSGSEVSDLEGVWDLESNVALDNGDQITYGSMLVLDNHITIKFADVNKDEMVWEWLGDLEKDGKEDGKTRYISKKSDSLGTASDAMNPGGEDDELVLYLEDSKLFFNDENGNKIEFTLTSKHIDSCNVIGDTKGRLFIQCGGISGYRPVDIENLEYTYEKTNDGYIYVTIRNTSDVTFANVDVRLVEFDDDFDSSGVMSLEGVNSYSLFGFEPGQTYKVKLTNTSDTKNYFVYLYYANTDVYSDVYPDLKKVTSADVDVKGRKNGDDIEISFTNNKEKDIQYVEYMVVFYKNGVIVDYGEKQEALMRYNIDEFPEDDENDPTMILGRKTNFDVTDIISEGETINITFESPDIDYDEFEVYMLNAVVKNNE